MKYDLRKCYSVKKLMILEFYFIFNYMGIESMAYKLGIKSSKIIKIVEEWKENKSIIVESKLNYLPLNKL